MSEPIAVSAGGFRWQIAPEHRELLLGPDGLRLDDWLRVGAARVVKHGPHRTVYRVSLPDLRFYVKHNRVHNVRALLRQLVRPSKSRIECNHARAIAERGVPTFLPLALGEQETGRKPGDSYLITASLEDTEPLSTFIETTFRSLEWERRARVRHHLAVALAGLMARMHDLGVTHNDLHAGNLLIRLGPDDQVHLFVIDLHAVSLGPPLSRRARRENLVMLNRWFIMRVSRTDRLRFWREYGKKVDRPLQSADSADHAAMDRNARDLERETVDSCWRFWRNRDRRCFCNNRYYRRVHSEVAAGHAVTELDRDPLATLLMDPDEPFRRAGITLLKDSRSSTVAEMELSVGGVSVPVIYKRFRVTTWTDPWVALVRKTPALRSWMHGHGLRERGLPTPRPLAVFHRRHHGLAHEGYLITEKIQGALELQRFVAVIGSLPTAEHRFVWRRLIDQVARLVRELHQRRLAHRDLKAANVLVTRGEDGKQNSSLITHHPSLVPHHSSPVAPSLWLIDLVGVANRRRLSVRRRVQNLARLHASFAQNPSVSRTDKVRFLRVYLQWGLLGRERWKRWWRQIEEATAAKVGRNRRAGRPLA
jgi:tRNA A-37 threonylcarbamoyl transferase component Bud32